ncbi:MOSC domain-containing protein [Actinomadura atramentaria]|uniref:MOSC domain-containing protein n=1 Tax=Actinomadura atramentaria TaxID=1990 RepID=UPI0003730C7C|nr:MOSC N-terminal beta barrel domain-containing protein [Actinomadura atramentaria]
MQTIEEIRRHPVKSMLGERVAVAEVTSAGVEGDRVLAVVDAATGRVASAKNPRLWRALLAVAARTTGDGVHLTFPDGRTLAAKEADAALSELVGRPVRLTDVPPESGAVDRAVPEQVLEQGITADVAVEPSALRAGSFHDFAPVHLLTTATLAAVAKAAETPIDPTRYRPNILINTPEAEPGYLENTWVGREIKIGDELLLRVIARTPRCAIPTLEHGPLPRLKEALGIPARDNRLEPIPGMTPRACAGIYATVLHPGVIHPGDPVHLR